jgi:hypothetical protein
MTPTHTATATATIAPIHDLRGFDYELWLNPQSPRQGSSTQIGIIVHRMGGVGPLSVEVRFYRGDPAAGGILLGTGQAPLLSPNSSGSTTPVLWTPELTGQVELYAVIDPDNRIVESDESNNVVMRRTTVLAPSADTIPPTVDSFTINGDAATTTQREVSLEISASDSGTNVSGVATLYVVEYQINLELGIWMPVQLSDSWLPYTPGVAYPWQLTESPGLRYLHVWAADQAGNVSPTPKRAYINYIPDTVRLAAAEVYVLRYDLNAGDRITVSVAPLSGDPDIYLWAPDALSLPRAPWYSNLGEGEVDQLDITAPVAGSYQLEVIGYTDTEFRLAVEIERAVTGAALTTASLDGVTAKEVRRSPVVPPMAVPGDIFTPPSQAEETVRIYLPVVQR